MKTFFRSTGKRLISSVSIFLLVGRSIAFCQSSNSPPALEWHEARHATIEGKGWTDTRDFYDRFPARAETQVRKNLWNLSHDSAGICLRFQTDAAEIWARWTLRKEALAMNHMPATGVSGVDLYVKTKGQWRWLGTGRPDGFPVNEKALVKGRKAERRECLLYLPLYNGVREVMIGVPSGASFEPGPARRAGAKPLVFYGTSILHGGCASRPGMAYPAILGRRLDWPHVNLGFSGNAWSEPEVATLLAELDPAVYVLDPLPNMTVQWVTQRIEPFVGILRKAHPETPIVLVENVPYADGDFVEARRMRYTNANRELRAAYERLRKAGDKRLYYVPATDLLGRDGEATVDGTHPTDLGFMRMADAIEPAIRQALKAPH